MCVSPCGHAPTRGRASEVPPENVKAAGHHATTACQSALDGGPGPVLVYVLGNGNYMLTSTRESRRAHVEPRRALDCGRRNGSERTNYNDLADRVQSEQPRLCFNSEHRTRTPSWRHNRNSRARRQSRDRRFVASRRTMAKNQG